MKIVSVCAEFLESCDRERHLAMHTLAAYRQDLEEFCRFFRASSIGKITGGRLVDYASYLTVERRLAPATVKRRLACVRAMFARLAKRGQIRSNPFLTVELRIRLPIRLPRCLAASEMRVLLNATESVCPTTKLATAILLATGVRISELAAIQLGDIDIKEGTIRIFGKGSRERQVFLPGEAMKALLEAYIADVHPSSLQTDRLFVNAFGRPATARGIRGRITSLGHRSGLARRVTPHMLRHTAATALIEAGVDIRIVQRLLGHQTIATTQIYTYVSDTTLKAAILAANVIGDFGEQNASRMAP